MLHLMGHVSLSGTSLLVFFGVTFTLLCVQISIGSLSVHKEKEPDRLPWPEVCRRRHSIPARVAGALRQ